MTITAQVTMSFDGVRLICEAANPTTGAREKLDMLSFHDLPIHIQVALRDNLAKAQAHRAEIDRLTALANDNARKQREDEVNARNAEAHREREARWESYIADLAPHVAAYHNAKRAARIAKSLETSRQIYGDIAEKHSIDLANRAIPPARRPRKVEMTKNGNKVTYYPQTDDTAGTKKAKKIAKKNGAVVHNHIDTSGFTF